MRLSPYQHKLFAAMELTSYLAGATPQYHLCCISSMLNNGTERNSVRRSAGGTGKAWETCKIRIDPEKGTTPQMILLHIVKHDS